MRAARDTTLVLMLKAPERSKRRLAASLGDAAAAEAAKRLARCALEDVDAWPGPVWLAPPAESDLAWLADAAADRPVVMQGEGNLGARIHHVSRTLHARGAQRQLFIGIDCPELDRRYLLRAAACLADHEAVLGPATDGGVVLMGARRPWPALEGLPWSTEELGARLEAACLAAGFSVATLEPKTDIDTLADLSGLGARLADDPRSGRRALCRWLEGVVGREEDA